MSTDGFFQVRGYSNVSHRAPWSVVFLALLTDLVLLSALTLWCLTRLGQSPAPSASLILLILFTSVAVNLSGLFFFKRTSGLSAWSVRLMAQGFTRSQRGLLASSRSAGITIALWIVAGWAVLSAIGTHPLWIQNPVMQLQAF